MIEAGAEEIPEDEILEAFEIAHAEIVKICDAQEDLRRQAGKPKYLDPELTAELGVAARGPDPRADRHEGLREAAGAVEELTAELAPELNMDSGKRTSFARSRFERRWTRFSKAFVSRWSSSTSASSSRTTCAH